MDALLYVAIVLVWAVVLVPTWLRKHEETAEARSVDRFSHAMRVLARREPKSRPATRYVVMPARERVAHVSVANAPEPVRAPRHAGRARLASRRRRVAVILAAVVVLALLLRVVGFVGLYAPVLAIVLLGSYLVHLRLQARRIAELDRRRQSSVARLSSRERRLDRAGRVAEVQRVREAVLLAEAEAAEIVRTDSERETLERAEAERLAAAGWEPMPVPLPTYVTKPKAVRQTRTIDLGATAWTASEPPAAVAGDEHAVQPDDAPIDVRPAVGSESVQDTDLQARVEPRRAVND